jgi:hypothetical protein
MKDIEFLASVRIWNNGVSPASRHFVTLPVEVATNIRILVTHQPKRWRWSIKVRVRIGRLSRETSIFPDTKTQSYLLPLKADVRKQLGIKEGDAVSVMLELI